VLESGGHYNWVFMTFVPGLWISTIYGGFHYAIDSIIGVGIGTLAALLCHYMVSSLSLSFSLSISHTHPLPISPRTHHPPLPLPSLFTGAAVARLVRE
jgi:hypothetical protein